MGPGYVLVLVFATFIVVKILKIPGTKAREKMYRFEFLAYLENSQFTAVKGFIVQAQTSSESGALY